ncbi:hypothetical protein PQQ64_03605 [Paraburkholderia graminis]|uniref:hypothetical protein n=1 Tax=Paraburkholderia graminis TaxID=60548 RepID=UPI0038BDD02E
MKTSTAFKNAMEVIHHLSDDKPPWDAFLQTSKELVGADATAFIMFDGEQNLDELKHSDRDSAPVREYLAHFYKCDAIAQASCKCPAGKWWDSLELASAPDARKLPFYADFMPRHRLGQVTALILLAEPGRRMSVSFHRNTARANAVEEFSCGNIRRFTDALLLAVSARTASTLARIAGVEAALSSIDEAIFLTNRKGELVRCSTFASKLLAEAKMLSASQGALCHPQPRLLEGMLGELTTASLTSRPCQYCVPLSWGVGIRFDVTVAPERFRLANGSLLLVRARKISAFDVPDVAELATVWLGSRL